MCNSQFMMCIGCATYHKKESSCIKFDNYQKENGCKDLYDKDWMLEHAGQDPAKVKINFKFKFCPECTTKDKDGFQPDVKKISKAAEKATRMCLGTFTFTYVDGNVINSWTKTDFGKMDPDAYLTTDNEADSDGDSSSDDDEDEDDDDDDDDEETSTKK